MNQTGKRQVVIAMREREGRTLVALAKSEAEGVAVTKANVIAGSTIQRRRGVTYWRRRS